MSKLKKVRCPNPECKRVFGVDVEVELKKYEQVVMKLLRISDIQQPKFMKVTCPHCGLTFKINL